MQRTNASSADSFAVAYVGCRDVQVVDHNMAAPHSSRAESDTLPCGRDASNPDGAKVAHGGVVKTARGPDRPVMRSPDDLVIPADPHAVCFSSEDERRVILITSELLPGRSFTDRPRVILPRTTMRSACAIAATRSSSVENGSHGPSCHRVQRQCALQRDREVRCRSNLASSAGAGAQPFGSGLREEDLAELVVLASRIHHSLTTSGGSSSTSPWSMSSSRRPPRGLGRRHSPMPPVAWPRLLRGRRQRWGASGPGQSGKPAWSRPPRRRCRRHTALPTVADPVGRYPVPVGVQQRQERFWTLALP